MLTHDNILLLPRIALEHHRSYETLKQDGRSILRSVDDTQSNNDNVMMSDLSARNAIEKFTVFETGPKSFSHKTSGSLHSEVFQLHGKPSSFPVRTHTLTFSNLYSAKELFLLDIFSKCC